MAPQTHRIDVDGTTIELVPAPEALLAKLRELWPTSVQQLEGGDEPLYGIVMQVDDAEVWGMKIQFLEHDESEKDYRLALRRYLIASALASYAPQTRGAALLPCGYARDRRGSWETGLALFVNPLRGGRGNYPELRRANFQEAFEAFGLGARFELGMEFWHAVGARMTEHSMAGWNALFPGAPYPFERDPCIDVDYRPRLMMGSIVFDFLLVDGELVCLRPNLRPGDVVWQALADSGVRRLWHLPAVPLALMDPNGPFAREAGDVVRIERTILEPDCVLVKGMLAVVQDGSFGSLGWDGCYRIVPIGGDALAIIRPDEITPRPTPTEDELAANAAMYADRCALAQRELGYRGIFELKGQLVGERQALRLLEAHLKSFGRLTGAGGGRKSWRGEEKWVVKFLGAMAHHPEAGAFAAMLDAIRTTPEDGRRLHTVAEELMGWLCARVKVLEGAAAKGTEA